MKPMMYLIILILSSSIFVNASTGDECLAPIFSIKPSLQFQRIWDFVDSATVKQDFNFLPNETIMTYLLVTTKELSEARVIGCQEVFLEDIPLRPAHLTFGFNKFTFVDVWWRNSSTFQEPTEDLKWMAQYLGEIPNPKSAKIKYEGAYPNEFVIDGFAKLLLENYSYGTEKYPFSLKLRNPQLSYEYHREKTTSGKIVTRSIIESLKFSGLDFKLPDLFPKQIPEQRLSQKLADSWLIPIARRIHDHIVKPRVLSLSKTFFQPYKNALLKQLSEEVLDVLLEPTFGAVIDEYFRKNTSDSEAARTFNKFVFQNFDQFRNNCVAESKSWLYRQGRCPEDDLYRHTFNFMYDIRQRKNQNATYPSISWSSEKIVKKDIQEDKRLQQFTSFHRQWILEMSIVTDKNGFVQIIQPTNVIFYFDTETPTEVSRNLSQLVPIIIEKKVFGRFIDKKK